MQGKIALNCDISGAFIGTRKLKLLSLLLSSEQSKGLPIPASGFSLRLAGTEAVVDAVPLVHPCLERG